MFCAGSAWAWHFVSSPGRFGYILVAKGKPVLHQHDLAWTVVNVVTWWCVHMFGLVGAGIAFWVCVFHVWCIRCVAG